MRRRAWDDAVHKATCGLQCCIRRATDREGVGACLREFSGMAEAPFHEAVHAMQETLACPVCVNESVTCCRPEYAEDPETELFKVEQARRAGEWHAAAMRCMVRHDFEKPLNACVQGLMHCTRRHLAASEDELPVDAVLQCHAAWEERCADDPCLLECVLGSVPEERRQASERLRDFPRQHLPCKLARLLDTTYSRPSEDTTGPASPP